MVVYIENLKESIEAKQNKTKLEIISESDKATGYKVNRQKSIAFVHTSNKEVDTKIKNTIPSIITKKKRERYLDIN